MAVPEKSAKCFHVFKSHLPAVNIILSGDIHKKLNGYHAKFMNHEFVTESEPIREELQSMIDAGIQGVYVDAADATRDHIDPMAELEAKFFKKFQEQQRAAMNPNRDQGTSDGATRLNVLSTAAAAPVEANREQVIGKTATGAKVAVPVSTSPETAQAARATPLTN